MTVYLVGAFILLLLAGLLLLRHAGRLRRRAGLPQGRVVYSDMRLWERVEEPLFSRRYRLSGRPDYLVETEGGVVPVEVKPNRSASQPYEGDILQLASYCLLLEENFGKRPAYGLIRYHDQTFAVDYTPELRRTLLGTLTAMRRDAAARNVKRSHEQAGRCRACGFRADCTQRLS